MDNDDFTFIETTYSPRKPAGRPKGSANRRQPIYKVVWQRGSSSSQAKLFTRFSAALAFRNKLQHPEMHGRGRPPRELTYVKLYMGSVVWDDIEEEW